VAATVVLVHGAWGGSWIWGPLIRELDARGIASRAVDLPSVMESSSLADVHDDAAHVRTLVDSIDTHVVLVGNSYGGAVISEASADCAKVTRLVYLAAFMPLARESLLAAMSENSFDHFGASITYRTDGRADLPVAAMEKYALQHAPPDALELFRRHANRPMSFGADPRNLALPAVGWATIPSTYVVCTDDLAIKPEAQRAWAKQRATDMVELVADHCPQLSCPVAIADILQGVV